ncbi:MAG TPA: twin-arginine translocase TatA/TatE family subunit [Candidatus Marinimicrobia bacterium]|nr:twin-arginine translocase TatA/TatE family subunit [Candidatus Neomarinimicrobiota bacterium]
MEQILHIPILIGGLGGWEVFLILLVVLLLFGAKRLPELARGLGKGIREFKGAIEGIEKELDETVDSIEKTAEKPDSPGE